MRPSRPRRWRLPALALAFIVGATQTAHATDPANLESEPSTLDTLRAAASDEPPGSLGPTRTEGDAVEARRSFRLGSELAERGQWPEALAAYEAAFHSLPHTTTLYNIGVCYRQLGQRTRAWLEIKRALAGAELPRERHLSPERMALANEQLQALELELARLVVADAPKGLVVMVDQRPLMSVGPTKEGPLVPVPEGWDPVFHSWSAATTVLVDPGAHIVELSAGGRQQAHHVELIAGQLRTLHWLSVPLPTAAQVPPRSHKSTALPASPPTRETGPTLRDASLVAAWSTAGLGVVTAAIGGTIAFSLHGRLSYRCPSGSCSSDQAERVERYQSAVHWTNGGLLVGLLGLGFGVGIAIGTSETKTPTRVQVKPTSVSIVSQF
jgi:hypothetical protein